MPIAVSACLAGHLCRYDGKYQGVPLLEEMVLLGQAVPLCPETAGGLGVPRVPAERRGQSVVDREGADVTERFELGAKRCAEQAARLGCTAAVLKARSPSCGRGLIYDGSFQKRLAAGDGVFAEKLRLLGIPLYTEEDFPPVSGCVGKAPAGDQDGQCAMDGAAPERNANLCAVAAEAGELA
ncbi:MAG: DUF523 domain-containing protein [Mailhella sp.]|nr:DUF523 domain-containing protein [Mailhella sp.]